MQKKFKAVNSTDPAVKAALSSIDPIVKMATESAQKQVKKMEEEDGGWGSLPEQKAEAAALILQIAASIQEKLQAGPPVISILPLASGKLNNGQVDIASFKITTPAKGLGIDLKRFAIKFNSSNGNIKVSNINVFMKKGNTTTPVKASIKNTAGKNLQAGVSNLSATDTIYVTLPGNNNTTAIIPGNEATFIIRATVADASVNDSITTQLLTDVEPVKNTYFDTLLKGNHNFIWTDMSGIYTTSNGHSTSSSDDWSNGGAIQVFPAQQQVLTF